MALPERVYAHASPLSIGGTSLFDASHRIISRRVGLFASDETVIGGAAQSLQDAGFEILQVTPFTINFAGAPDLFEKAFRKKIVEKEMPRVNGPTTTHLHCENSDMLGLIPTDETPFADFIEGIALESPRQFMSASAMPPVVDYWHLRVPADVAVACNASVVHRDGITGRGVRVAMVDSGWYRHPYFTAHGYNVAPVVLGPAATKAHDDESGHGTGESANILAIAPECELLPVKMNFVNSIGAFNAAVALQPDIISCSWGSHTPFQLSAADRALASSIAAAVASGITVIFSAGNGHAGFPGQHPDVISAGGVFMDQDGNLQASDYSSAFSSQIYPGRAVPDVSGVVGMKPKAIYILLPVQPGDSIDAGNGGQHFPDKDQTATGDGWAAFSGTSAAAPQLAGVSALIKQVNPELSPLAVKYSLIASGREVLTGVSNRVPDLHPQGLPAGPSPSEACGYGLVDAYQAVQAASMMSPGTAHDSADFESMDPVTAAYWQGYQDGLALG